MAVYVGSARQDERGKYSGGAAGDQTGKEVSYQTWYKHSKGWRVFRAKDTNVRKRLAYAMKAACDNNNIGYSQSDRNSLYNAVKNKGFDPAKCTVKCNTDCSALVRVCICYATGKTIADFNTSLEPTILLKSGLFSEIDQSMIKEKYCEAGDIYVTKTSGHTVIALTSGSSSSSVSFTNTTSTNTNTSSASSGVATATIKSGYKGNNVKLLQQNLNKVLGTNLAVDGAFGPAGVAALKQFQQKYGLTADGIYGPTCYAKMKDVIAGKATPVSNTTSSSKVAVPTVKNGTRGDNAKLLQQNLNTVLGTKLDTDGIFGSASVAALKQFQQKYGLTADGIYGTNGYNKMKTLIK